LGLLALVPVLALTVAPSAKDGYDLYTRLEPRQAVTEQYRREAWDLSAFVGEQVYVLMMDQSTGGWGHINVDNVNVPVRLN
jgi:hypothetical protein